MYNVCLHVHTSMQVRSQRDQLHLELVESKKFTEILKQSYDKERNKREATEVKFMNTNECVERINKNVKKLEKIWNDTKLSMEKRLLIPEVCLSYTQLWLYCYYIKLCRPVASVYSPALYNFLM